MTYEVGDSLKVEGTVFWIEGKVRYRSLADQNTWEEYRLRCSVDGTEHWLSVDDHFREYSISRTVYSKSKTGYHQVDEGTEEVVACWGDVDVEPGDRAQFVEYEDITEEKIISSEIWDDGEELSEGYYLDADEFGLWKDYGSGITAGARERDEETSGNARVFIMSLLIIGLVIGAQMVTRISAKKVPSIHQICQRDFTYVTSITGEKNQKAHVFKSNMDLDSTVKHILLLIKGNSEDAQQNTEEDDNSVAIMTQKEYCLVYESEDQDVLIQISDREFNYYNDSAPYHSTRRTHRFYRSHYYSRAYTTDWRSFSGGPSPYESYAGDYIPHNSADSYNVYSNNIRQSSVHARHSSGGGTGYGK